MVLPFDFLYHNWTKLEHKANKLVAKLVLMIKQVIYELSFESNHMIKTLVISLCEANSPKEKEIKDRIASLLLSSINR